MLRVFLVIVLGALLAVGIGMSVVRWQAEGDAEVATAPGTDVPAVVEPESTTRIKVNLFYMDEDGTGLVAVEREVVYAKAVVDQARLILEEQLKPPPDPLGPVVPENVTLRAFYLTEKGEGFADFSSEISTGHVGGSLDEMLTVYALVNAVTVNLPSVKTLQILIDGREADTLAGHIDLRHPLGSNTSVVRNAQRIAAAAEPEASSAARADAPPQVDGGETGTATVAPAAPERPNQSATPTTR